MFRVSVNLRRRNAAIELNERRANLGFFSG